MFNTIFKLGITFLLLLTAHVSHAESISTFHSDMLINEDASVTITETIVYDFQDNQRRGIFRTIPYTFQMINSEDQERTYTMDIQLVSVTRNGSQEPYQLEDTLHDFFVRIGNEEVFLTGVHTYEITYIVHGALRYFDTYDELYWNVTGNEWGVPMNQASATLRSSILSFEDNACYTGPLGSTQSCEQLEKYQDHVIFSQENLIAGDGLSVASSFAKGLVPVVQYELPDQPFLPSLIVPIVFTSLGLMLFFAIAIKKRKHFYREPVVTEFEPYQNLNPISTGYVMDTSLDARDISAGIIYAAQRGYLTITHIPKKHLFSRDDFLFTLNSEIYEKNQPLSNDLAFIIALLFQETPSASIMTERTLSDIQSKRGKKIYEKEQVKKYIRNELMDRQLLEKIPFFGFNLYRLTKEGWGVHYYLKGFKRFLSMTEKERYAFFNNPTNMKGEEFMQYLPYAIAFGVEKKWALQFKHITIDDTSWYQGSPHDSLLVAHSLTNMTSAIGSYTSTQSSGSGGGGSSGGGSGGGGGGSW